MTQDYDRWGEHDTYKDPMHIGWKIALGVLVLFLTPIFLTSFFWLWLPLLPVAIWFFRRSYFKGNEEMTRVMLTHEFDGEYMKLRETGDIVPMTPVERDMLLLELSDPGINTWLAREVIKWRLKKKKDDYHSLRDMYASRGQASSANLYDRIQSAKLAEAGSIAQREVTKTKAHLDTQIAYEDSVAEDQGRESADQRTRKHEGLQDEDKQLKLHQLHQEFLERMTQEYKDGDSDQRNKVLVKLYKKKETEFAQALEDAYGGPDD